jgi:hypothetical protein
MTSARHMDEFDQGLKRAKAVPIAHPLRAQSGIHSTEESSYEGPVARIMQL